MILYKLGYGQYHKIYFRKLENVQSVEELKIMYKVIYKNGSFDRVKNLYFDMCGKIFYTTETKELLKQCQEIILKYKNKIQNLKDNPVLTKKGVPKQSYLKEITSNQKLLKHYRDIISNNFTQSIQYILED